MTEEQRKVYSYGYEQMLQTNVTETCTESFSWRSTNYNIIANSSSVVCTSKSCGFE